MGQMSTEETTVRAYERILRAPYNSPQKKAIAEMVMKSLRDY